MSSMKEKDAAGLMIESLTDLRTKFAKKTGWYIPTIHEKYIKKEDAEY
jgi:hypothetical protein